METMSPAAPQKINMYSSVTIHASDPTSSDPTEEKSYSMCIFNREKYRRGKDGQIIFCSNVKKSFNWTEYIDFLNMECLKYESNRS